MSILEAEASFSNVKKWLMQCITVIYCNKLQLLRQKQFPKRQQYDE